MPLFLYGTLQHPPLFEIVAGGPISGTAIAAHLPDHRIEREPASGLPVLLSGGNGADGLLWRNLTPEQAARLDLYELPFGYERRPVSVITKEGPIAADAYFPPADHLGAGAPWSLAEWREAGAELALLAAAEVYGHDPLLAPDELVRQWRMIRARAEAAHRARASQPVATRRHKARPEDFAWRPASAPSGQFFKIHDLRMEHSTFAGGRSEPLQREVLIGVDAALVLPYDPESGNVLLVEQFRAAPARRGDPNPWTLEPVAGMIDPGESPVEAGIRECVEEAGLHLQGVTRMFGVYPSPGSTTDYFHCFLGHADLPEPGQYHGGLEEEGEDIRLHVLPLDAALGLIDSGEITAAPLVAMLLWIERHRRAPA